MPEYNLDWRLKLFLILWIAILLLLTGFSIIRTRKYWIQMRRLEEAIKESWGFKATLFVLKGQLISKGLLKFSFAPKNE